MEFGGVDKDDARVRTSKERSRSVAEQCSVVVAAMVGTKKSERSKCQKKRVARGQERRGRTNRPEFA